MRYVLAIVTLVATFAIANVDSAQAYHGRRLRSRTTNYYTTRYNYRPMRVASPGYEYQTSRYQARTTAGYVSLFSF